MNDQSWNTKLTQVQKNAARKLVTAHDKWNDYRKAQDLDTAYLTATQILRAANAFGIEPSLYMNATAPDTDTAPDAEEGATDAVERAPAIAAAQITNTALAAPSKDGAAEALATLIGQIAGKSLSVESVRDLVNEQIEQRFRDMPTVHVKCQGTDGVERDVEGHKHPMFMTLLRAAAARLVSGYAPNMYICGPAGSGKTHAAHMLSTAMGLEFYIQGACAMSFELLGYQDANGVYHDTQFRKAFEFGGVIVLDELDAYDNGALLALMAALANGVCPFPDRKVVRHKDCIIVATANTWGLGATADFVGRAKIDAAFLSRFPVKLAWDYDTALEVRISGNEKFARRVIDARERARTHKLKILIDPRHSQAGSALIAAGMTSDEAAALTYLAGLTPENVKLVEGN